MMLEEDNHKKKMIDRLKQVIRKGNRHVASEALLLLEEEGEIDIEELQKEIEGGKR